MSVEKVKQLLATKKELGYELALQTLARMQEPTVASALPAAELAAAKTLECSLRKEIRSGPFDRMGMYKNARALFRGEADHTTTWHVTLLRALALLPARHRVSGLFTAEKPLVLLWLGARDDNEGAADFRALEEGLCNPKTNGGCADVGAVHIYLVGPPPMDGRAGLSPSPKLQQYGRLRVHRVVGFYPAAAPIPTPHYAVAFNAGLDAHFFHWAPAIQHLARLNPQPLLLTTGYSTDDSSLQDELLLQSLGMQILLPTRPSIEGGFALMPPHVSNHHVTWSRGESSAATSLALGNYQLEQLADQLRQRGFDIRARS